MARAVIHDCKSLKTLMPARMESSCRDSVSHWLDAKGSICLSSKRRADGTYLANVGTRGERWLGQRKIQGESEGAVMRVATKGGEADVVIRVGYDVEWRAMPSFPTFSEASAFFQQPAGELALIVLRAGQEQ